MEIEPYAESTAEGRCVPGASQSFLGGGGGIHAGRAVSTGETGQDARMRGLGEDRSMRGSSHSSPTQAGVAIVSSLCRPFQCGGEGRARRRASINRHVREPWLRRGLRCCLRGARRPALSPSPCASQVIRGSEGPQIQRRRRRSCPHAARYISRH